MSHGKHSFALSILIPPDRSKHPPNFSNTSPRISHARGLVLDKFTVGNKLVIKLYEKRKCVESRVPPPETTQLGLSRSLGIRVTHVANELKDLERDGYVQFRKTWVADAHGKRKVYNLTSAGYELARSLAESRGIDLSAKPVNPKAPDDDWLPELKNEEN